MTNLVAKILTGEAALAVEAGPLFEAHPAPSLLFARSGVVTQANAAARALLRAGTASLAGAALADFCPEIGTSLLQISGAVTHARVAVRRPDGSNFIACLRATPLEATAGTSLLATFDDLTHVEHEIAAANREFESLTSAAGHDLRGPLRILKGFAEALEDECGAALSEEGRTFLGEILKAGDRMDGLIEGLLAYSRAGRAEMNPERLDLTTLVELVYFELRHAHTERAIECRVDPGISAWGDVRLIMTLLRNLLGNAWKFTARTAQATIHFHTEQRDGRTWFCVTDNGAGFDMAQADRLFKPFTRLHRQDEFPGHGLGLATTQRIVARHGGAIAAQAMPGQGASLRFWMPGVPE